VRASLNAATTAMLEAAGVKKPAKLLALQRRHGGSIATATSAMLEAKKPVKVIKLRASRKA
jgi:hypothetical protein